MYTIDFDIPVGLTINTISKTKRVGIVKSYLGVAISAVENQKKRGAFSISSR